MYACPQCGFVHNGKDIEKIKIDRKSIAGLGGTKIKTTHKYEYYRICPKCGYKHNFK